MADAALASLGSFEERPLSAVSRSFAAGDDELSRSLQANANANTTGRDVFFRHATARPAISPVGEVRRALAPVQRAEHEDDRVASVQALDKKVSDQQLELASNEYLAEQGYKSLGARVDQYADPTYGGAKPEQALEGGKSASPASFGSDLDQIYAQAALANIPFKAAVISLASSTGGTPQFRSVQVDTPAHAAPAVVDPAVVAAAQEQRKIDNLDGTKEVGLKGRARATEKGNSDYKGMATGLVDILGGTIEYSTFGAMCDGLKRVGSVGLTSVREKNRMLTPTAQGYRDIMLNVLVAGTGHIAELQFNLTAMLEAKSAGHKQYEEARAMEAHHQQLNIALDAASFKRLKVLYDEMRVIYKEAAIAAGITDENLAAAFPPPGNA